MEPDSARLWNLIHSKEFSSPFPVLKEFHFRAEDIATKKPTGNKRIYVVIFLKKAEICTAFGGRTPSPICLSRKTRRFTGFLCRLSKKKGRDLDCFLRETPSPICLSRKTRRFTGFLKWRFTNFPHLPDVVVISADDDSSLDFARGNRLVEALRNCNPAHLVRVQNSGL
jgi:hypothetical protein